MNDKTKPTRQSIENLKGEIEFRAKLATQHVSGEVLLPGYYNKEEHDKLLRERVEATHKKMKELEEMRVNFSPFLELGAERGQRQGLNSEDIAVQTIGYTLLAFLFGAILALAIMRAPETALGKAFASPALAFFGRYSYALYVFHQPIVFYLEKHILSVGALPRLMGSQLPGQILFIIIATGVSLAFALLSWHLVEQPFLRLKRLFPYQYKTKTTAMPSINQHGKNFPELGH